MKSTDPGYAGFGEAYFSVVDAGALKGWKQHTRMVMNLIVVAGTVRFYIRNDAGIAWSVRLSPYSFETHKRLTLPPMLWLAFEGLDEGTNMVLNMANLIHDPGEANNEPVTRFPLYAGHVLG